MSILPKPGIHAHRDLSCVHTHTHTTWQRWSSISMDKQLPPAEALHKDPKADNLGFIHWLPCQVLLYSFTSFIFLKESRIYWKVFPNEAEKLLYCWVRQGWEKLSSGSLRGTDSTSPSYYVWMTGPCLFLTCWAWSPCLLRLLFDAPSFYKSSCFDSLKISNIIWPQATAMCWGIKAHCHWIVGKNRLRQDSQSSFLAAT